MLSRISSKLTPLFSFARIAGYPHISDKIFKDLYNNNQSQLSSHFQQLTKLGLKPRGITKLFKVKPNLFKSQQGDMKIKQAIANAKSKYGPKAIYPIQLFPQLLQNNDIQHYIQVFQKYKFTEEQINNIFEIHPQALTSNLQFRVKNIKSMLTNYFQMTSEQANAAIAKFPFLVMVRHQRYIESVKFLSMKGIPTSTLKQLLYTNVDIFDMGSNRLSILFSIPERWGVSKETVLKVILQNIEYLSQCPFQMIFKKIDIMNNFKIPQRIAKIIFEQYPQVIVSSIHSLDAKLILINERLKIPLQVSELFPYMLSLNYNAVLRPRSQTILKYNLDLSKAQFESSDEEFSERNGIPLDTYLNEKRKYKITTERDVKKKFYTNSLKGILSEETT